MDSETYRQPAADARRAVHGGRHRLPDTRYPYRALGSQALDHGPAWIAEGEVLGLERINLRSRTSGRLRAAMLIVIAVVALSAIAAIGWMQYQKDADRQDPRYEISEPSRSVPALADSARR